MIVALYALVSIADKMLHVKCLVGLFVLAMMWCWFQYKETDLKLYRWLELTFCGIGLGIIMLAVIVTPKHFHSSEVVTCAVGYVAIRYTSLELMMISNGREYMDRTDKGMLPEIYIAKPGCGEEALAARYREKYGDDVRTLYVESENITWFYRSDEQLTSRDALLDLSAQNIIGSAMCYPKQGYDIIKFGVNPVYAHKNIFGYPLQSYRRIPILF